MGDGVHCWWRRGFSGGRGEAGSFAEILLGELGVALSFPSHDIKAPLIPGANLTELWLRKFRFLSFGCANGAVVKDEEANKLRQ